MMSVVRPALRCVALILLLSGGAAAAQTDTALDCTQKLVSSVERRICADPQLSALDRQLADVYAAAVAQVGPASAVITNVQRGWATARNQCWKSTNVPACIESSYRTRIAELQARYRLVAPVGSARYACPATPPVEATADFFATRPATAMIGFDGSTQLMFVAESGSGARYTGGGRQFWEHQGVAAITWVPNGPEVQCPMVK